MNIAEKVEAVLNRDGWSHGKANGPNGEKCVLRASWSVEGMHIGPTDLSSRWFAAMYKASHELFPERYDLHNPLGAPGQVSDHPDTTREDISLLLKHAQAYMDEEG